MEHLGHYLLETVIIILLARILDYLKALYRRRSVWDRVLMDEDGFISNYDANAIRRTLGLEDR